MQERITLQNHVIDLYGDPAATHWIIQPVDAQQSKQSQTPQRAQQSQQPQQLGLLKQLLPGQTVFLIVLHIQDWYQELSPWKAEPVFGKQGFGGGAPDTLHFLCEQLLPELEKRYLVTEKRQTVLVGYSLAGLFALWACYQTNRFAGVAAVSPSVWFPEWLSYVRERKPMAKAIYLSLGDREEKAKNPVMASVGNAIREQSRLLEETGIRSTLEWNPGNHFTDPELRVAKGIAWVVEQKID